MINFDGKDYQQPELFAPETKPGFLARWCGELFWVDWEDVEFCRPDIMPYYRTKQVRVFLRDHRGPCLTEDDFVALVIAQGQASRVKDWFAADPVLHYQDKKRVAEILDRVEQKEAGR